MCWIKDDETKLWTLSGWKLLRSQAGVAAAYLEGKKLFVEVTPQVYSVCNTESYQVKNEKLGITDDEPDYLYLVAGKIQVVPM